jgi:hypothetical protein
MKKWWWKASYIETCNCAHGCACNLTMIPTDNTCQAIDAWQISEGEYDGTKLNGTGLALILRWPNPIHEGNGRAVVFIDERAAEKQRAALAEIGTGQAGPGGPFEVFATTYAEPPEVRFGPFEFERDGKRGHLRLGEVARAEIGPVHSAMDNAEADAHMLLPSGFIWQDGVIVNTDSCVVKVPGLEFSHRDSSAFFSEVEYNT